MFPSYELSTFHPGCNLIYSHVRTYNLDHVRKPFSCSWCISLVLFQYCCHWWNWWALDFEFYPQYFAAILMLHAVVLKYHYLNPYGKISGLKWGLSSWNFHQWYPDINRRILERSRSWDRLWFLYRSCQSRFTSSTSYWKMSFVLQDKTRRCWQGNSLNFFA